MARAMVVALVLGCLGLAACCPKPPREDGGPVPPPVSVGQQVRELNARAKALTGLKATGHVHARWIDEEGKRQDKAADGTLLFRQTISPSAAPTVDMLLLGKYVGSPVFELGSNQEFHWMAIKVDPQRAYVGRIGGPGADAIPLKAEDVARLLALAWLYEIRAAGPAGQRLVMTVSDVPAVNEVMVIKTPAQGGAWVERVDVVNRRSGHVDAVRLYRPDGTLYARARLEDYRPVNIDEETIPADERVSASLPTKVHIEYPDVGKPDEPRAVVDLTFNGMLATRLGPEPFEMPDFREQGLKVIDVDAAAQRTGDRGGGR